MAAASDSFNIIHLFFGASLIVQLVIIILLGASIVSWAIFLDRYNLYKNIENNIKQFENIFWSGRSFEQIAAFYEKQTLSDISLVFMSVVKEWQKSKAANIVKSPNFQLRINKAIDLAINRSERNMQKYLAFLASVSSCGPFIGLFGTVIGIMSAFSSIAAAKNTSLAVVAPGIAEALLATAIGLFAAIPALILYNKLLGMMHKLVEQMENFSDEFSIILLRQIEEKQAKSDVS